MLMVMECNNFVALVNYCYSLGISSLIPIVYVGLVFVVEVNVKNILKK